MNTIPVSTTPNANFTSATSSSVTLPTLTSAGATVTGTLPSANAIAAVSESISASVPSGVPALAVSRTTASTRALQALPAATPIEYVEFSSSTSVTFSAGGTLSVALPQLTAGVSYDLAEYATPNWTAPVAGPGTLAGTTVTLSGLPSFTVGPGAPLIFVLYSIVASGSPSPSPSPAPVVLSTSSLAFNGTGTSNAQTVTASQISSSSFAATTAGVGQNGSCSGIATISPTSGTTFTVTPVAAGTCTFTIAGAGGQSATVSIVVTTTALGGS